MFKKFFFFSKGEKTGLIILILLTGTAFVVNASFVHFLSNDQIKESEYMKEIEQFKHELSQEPDKYKPDKSKISLTLKEDAEQKTVQRRSTALPNNFISVEINSADTAELKKLKGIGSTYAKRIVKFRNYLGGFYTLEQIKEVYGIDEKLFSSIKKNLTLDTTKIRKFNVNCDSFTYKFRHPYLSKKDVKMILKKKQETEKISKENLPLILSLSEEKWNKLSPYVVD